MVTVGVEWPLGTRRIAPMQNEIRGKTVHYKIQLITTLSDSLWHDWFQNSKITKFSFRMDAFDEADRLMIHYNFIKDTRIIRVTTTYSVIDNE